MAIEDEIRQEFEAHRAEIKAIADGAFELEGVFRQVEGQIEENTRRLERIAERLGALPSRPSLTLVKGEDDA